MKLSSLLLPQMLEQGYGRIINHLLAGGTNRLPVLGHDLGNYALHLGLDFVHHFHGLDNADDRVFVHFLADIDKGRRLR